MGRTHRNSGGVYPRGDSGERHYRARRDRLVTVSYFILPSDFTLAGSGKTGAFAIPILHALLLNPQRLFAVILAPTRELAFQINDVFEALGAAMSLRSVCVVGGIDMMSQSIALAKKPHVIVATPGRLVDHLENSKGFSLRSLKYLVLDEADRMLSMDFEEEINKILAAIPRERNTFLFSATMTTKVAKLQKASLTSPVKVEVSNKFQTPKVSL